MKKRQTKKQKILAKQRQIKALETEAGGLSYSLEETSESKSGQRVAKGGQKKNNLAAVEIEKLLGYPLKLVVSDLTKTTVVTMIVVLVLGSIVFFM